MHLSYNMDAYASLFGFIGTCLATAINFTSIPRFFTLWKTQDLNLISHTFFLFNCLNSALWLSVGVATGTDDIIRANTVVLTCSTLYLAIYHTVKKDLVKFMSLYIAVMIGLLYTLVTYVNSENITMVAGIVNILLVLAPLEQLKHVLREKSGKYIDMNMMCIALPCGFCWMMYGVCLRMWQMIVPNLIGTLSCVVMICMYFAFQPKGESTTKSTSMKKGR